MVQLGVVKYSLRAYGAPGLWWYNTQAFATSAEIKMRPLQALLPRNNDMNDRNQMIQDSGTSQNATYDCKIINCTLICISKP